MIEWNKLDKETFIKGNDNIYRKKGILYFFWKLADDFSN